MSHPAIQISEWLRIGGDRSDSGRIYRLQLSPANKNKKRGTPKQRVPRGNKKAAKNKTSGTGQNRVTQLSRMVSDPCNGPLVKGLYGDHRGVLSRFRSTTNAGVNDSYYSVILWNPATKRPQATANGQTFNVLWFQTQASNERPSNTNWGFNPTNGGVSSAQDPESIALYGSSRNHGAGISAQSRTLAACIKATYTGQQGSFQGMVYPLTNIPADIMFTAPSIDIFRQYATHGSRNFEYEVRYTPARNASEFSDNSKATSAFIAGPAAGLETASPDATLIGLLFYNCNAFDFAIDLYKVVEWMPEVGRGFPLSPIENVGEYDTFSRVTAYLNRTFGSDWQTRLMHNAGNAIIEAVSNLTVGVGRKAPAYRPRISL